VEAPIDEIGAEFNDCHPRACLVWHSSELTCSSGEQLSARQSFDRTYSQELAMLMSRSLAIGATITITTVSTAFDLSLTASATLTTNQV